MDKNTIWGILLMGAVIFGFMWLNQPSAEQRAQMEKERQEQLMAEQEKSASTTVLTVDSVNAAEIAGIRSTVTALGTLDSVSGVRTLASAGAEVTLSPEGTLAGTVKSAGKNVPVADIISAASQGLTPAEAQAALAAFRKAMADAARYRGFARYLSGDSTTVRLENSRLTLEISNKGAMIASASLKDYQTYDSAAEQPIGETTDTTVTMQLDLGDGAVWGIRYTLHPDSYLVTMDLLQQGMSAIIPTSVATIDFTWDQRMTRNELGRVFEERNSALYYMFVGGDVDNLKESGDETKQLSERVKWIGYKNQFFSSVIIPRTNFTGAEVSTAVLENNPKYLKNFSTRAELEYSANAANPASFTLFLGPNSFPLLKDIEKTVSPDENMHFTKLIPLGWPIFRWINTLIVIPVFDFLSKYITSYGLIIFLLTIFIKIILFPFTYKSYMSQARMRILAPDIKAINEKYPGKENAMKRQQETMALYSRAGANPMSGCLPMLLQMPILIAMFNFFPSAIELRGESFLWAKDLSAPDAIISWTTNIPFISSTFGNHISLFCLLMTVVNIVYMRINMQTQANADAMPGMKMMNYLMPLMFLFFFNNYASGLSYYYLLSLLITIIQTYIFRHVVKEETVREIMRKNAKKPKKKSGFMARLEEAQRQQQALLREQEKRKKASGKK